MKNLPSFFCIEIEQFGHFFELVTSHKQLAAISSSSSVPFTKDENKKTIVFFFYFKILY